MTRDELNQVTTLVHSYWPQWIEDRKSRSEGGEVLYNAERVRYLWDGFNRYRVDDVCFAIRAHFRVNPDGFPKWARVSDDLRTQHGQRSDDGPRWSWRDENTLRDICRQLAFDMQHGRFYKELCEDGERRNFQVTSSCLEDSWILDRHASMFHCVDPTPAERNEAQAKLREIRGRKDGR